MTFVDARHLIALYNPGDALSARATLWSEIAEPPFVVTEAVLWEAIDAFSAPHHRHRARQMLETLYSIEDLEIVWSSQEFFGTAVAFHQSRLDKDWSLTDCAAFVVMQQRGIQLALTCDRCFEQAGFKALLRRDP